MIGLQRYVAQRPAPVLDHCAFCSEVLLLEHRHAVDREARQLVCLCPACALVCTGPRPGLRHRTVPERVLSDPALRLTEQDLASLGLPVRLAFLTLDGGGSWSACYPSPAGATRSPIASAPIAALAERTPLVQAVEPEVEALFIRGRRPGEPVDCLLAPIDRCYALVGRVRRAWRGFDGGETVHAEVEAVVAELLRRARPLPNGGPTR
jgi:hypothetical protein